jgi:NADPH:quinone reductase-like Zn-dependent oxidoreductase
MKAVWFESFGAANDVLIVGEREMPVAGDGEVLVRLSTSAINPSDVKKRAGSAPGGLLDQEPVIPHSDGAGVIEAIGSGVAPERLGERVWVYQAQHGRRFGTAAGYVALNARRAVQLPENTSYEVGACIGIPLMTAHRERAPPAIVAPTRGRHHHPPHHPHSNLAREARARLARVFSI